MLNYTLVTDKWDHCLWYTHKSYSGITNVNDLPQLWLLHYKRLYILLNRLQRIVTVGLLDKKKYCHLFANDLTIRESKRYATILLFFNRFFSNTFVCINENTIQAEKKN